MTELWNELGFGDLRRTRRRNRHPTDVKALSAAIEYTLTLALKP